MTKVLLKVNNKVMATDGKLMVGNPTPSGTLEITENGTHNVREYESVEVNVAGSRDFTIENAILEGTLTEYSNPYLTKIKGGKFSGDTSLKSVDLPNVTKFEDTSTFYGCKNLESVSLASLQETTGMYTFNNCYSLKSVYIPVVKMLYGNTFERCYSLKKVLIERTDGIPTIYASCFSYCYHILGTVNSTYNPNGDKDGYIYVPASLLSQYKVASNWVTYETQIIGHQDFNVGDTLPSYANDTYTTCTWYSDETLTNIVTSVATQGRYYCRLEA